MESYYDIVSFHFWLIISSKDIRGKSLAFPTHDPWQFFIRLGNSGFRSGTSVSIVHPQFYLIGTQDISVWRVHLCFSRFSKTSLVLFVLAPLSIEFKLPMWEISEYYQIILVWISFMATQPEDEKSAARNETTRSAHTCSPVYQYLRVVRTGF